MQSTDTRWIKRQEVEQMLRDAGMPCSRATVERYTELSDFPAPRQPVPRGTRLWDRELVEAWIVRSRCIDPDADQRGAA